MVSIMPVHIQKINQLKHLIPNSIKYQCTYSYNSIALKKPMTKMMNHSSVNTKTNCCTLKSFHSSAVWLKSNKRDQKSKGSQKYADDDEDDNMVAIEDEEEGFDSNSSKVLILRVSSFRVDTVLRSAFQIARNKIEKLFYESKIRVNGYKIIKKSHNVALGDEIDIVKGFSSSNPKFLIVQRVKILAAAEPSDDNNENTALKIRRYKSLTIDNYEEDVYKESTASDS